MLVQQQGSGRREGSLEPYGVDLFDLHDREAMLRLRRVYYGQVTYIDRKFGALFDCLQAIGQLDDTVILFTMDSVWPPLQ